MARGQIAHPLLSCGHYFAQAGGEVVVARGDAHRYFLRICPYRTADDRIDGVVITLVDITSLHAMERALARSRERYRLLVDSAQEYVMFTMDGAGRIDT